MGVPAWWAAWIAATSDTSSSTSASERSSVPSRTIAGTFRPVAPYHRSRMDPNLAEAGRRPDGLPPGRVRRRSAVRRALAAEPRAVARGDSPSRSTFRFPFESAESVNFTHAVLFVFDLLQERAGRVRRRDEVVVGCVRDTGQVDLLPVRRLVVLVDPADGDSLVARVAVPERLLARRRVVLECCTGRGGRSRP